MGLLDRFKKKKQAKTASDYRAEREGYNPLVNGLDPASTALLYTTVASDHVDDKDTPDLSDDTAKDDTFNHYDPEPLQTELSHPSYEHNQTDTYSSGGSDYSSSDTSSYSDTSSSDTGSFSSSD